METPAPFSFQSKYLMTIINDSYATVQEADQYHSIRQNTAWDDATNDAREAALVRATDYIDALYRAKSPRTVWLQPLQWPTLEDAQVPASVVRATVELALYALTGPLFGPPAARGIKSTKLEGDAGKKEVVYDDITSGDPYPAITNLLADVAFLKTSIATSGGSLIIGKLT